MAEAFCAKKCVQVRLFQALLEMVLVLPLIRKNYQEFRLYLSIEKPMPENLQAFQMW